MTVGITSSYRPSSSYYHDRATVRSGAGTPQVHCQEWCRYPAGALSGVVQVPRRCTVRSGAEIGLLRLIVFQGASLGDFLLAPACSIEKVTLWEGFLCLTSGSETDEGVAKGKVFARTGNLTHASK